MKPFRVWLLSYPFAEPVVWAQDAKLIWVHASDSSHYAEHLRWRAHRFATRAADTAAGGKLVTNDSASRSLPRWLCLSAMLGWHVIGDTNLVLGRAPSPLLLVCHLRLPMSFIDLTPELYDDRRSPLLR